MRLPHNWIQAMTMVLCCFLVGCGSSTPNLASRKSMECSLGTQLGEGRQLLAPRAGTFYSVDALNPDVVVFHGRYLMYFSGNDRHTEAGNWRTGLVECQATFAVLMSLRRRGLLVLRLRQWMYRRMRRAWVAWSGWSVPARVKYRSARNCASILFSQEA
jgi:hypothetical protein